MKRYILRIIFAAAIIAAAIAMAGCKEEPPVIQDPPEPPVTQNTLSVDLPQLTFAAGDTAPKEVKVTTDAEDWSAECSADWLQIEEDKAAQTLRVSVLDANLTSAPFTDEIVFTAGDAPEVRLPVKQMAVPVIEEFDTFGLFFYYGNSFRNGVANFVLNCFNSSKGDIGISIDGFCELPEDGYAGFTITEGRYTISESCERMTLLPGVTELSTLGTYIYKGIAPDINEIIITGGTMDVSRDGDIYTIVTNFSGYDFKDKDTPLENLHYRFVGRIDYNDAERVRDYSSDIIGDEIAGNYSAKGTASYLVDGTAPANWTGSITADATVEGRFTFSGGYLDHWGRVEQNELLLDGNNSIVKSNVGSVAVDVYVRAFVIVDGRIFWAFKDGTGYDYPTRYDKNGGYLMFRNRMTHENGQQYDVLIGAIGIDSEGEVYILSECYKDLEYKLDRGGARSLPGSRALVAAESAPVAAKYATGLRETETVAAGLRLSSQGFPFKRVF
jgi:hypothetical protein